MLVILDITKLSMHLTFTEDKMRRCLDHGRIGKLNVGESFDAIYLLIPKDLQRGLSQNNR